MVFAARTHTKPERCVGTVEPIGEERTSKRRVIAPAAL